MGFIKSDGLRMKDKVIYTSEIQPELQKTKKQKVIEEKLKELAESFGYPYLEVVRESTTGSLDFKENMVKFDIHKTLSMLEKEGRIKKREVEDLKTSISWLENYANHKNNYDISFVPGKVFITNIEKIRLLDERDFDEIREKVKNYPREEGNQEMSKFFDEWGFRAVFEKGNEMVDELRRFLEPIKNEKMRHIWEMEDLINQKMRSVLGEIQDIHWEEEQKWK